jgi:hypothetical protein
MVDFSINGIKISILLTKFSLIPLNLGGISIMRIVLPFKILDWIRSASRVKRMNSDLF